MRFFFALTLWKLSGWLEMKGSFHSLQIKKFHKMKLQAIFLPGISERVRVLGTE